MNKLLCLLVLFLGLLISDCQVIQYKYIYTNNRLDDNIPTKLIISIYVDKNFSTNDKIAIDNSINQWNYVLNKQIILNVIDYNFDMEPDKILKAQNNKAFLFLNVNSHTSIIPDEVPEEKCRNIKGCQLTVAWTDKIGGTILKIVRNRVNTEDIEYITLHEIGHLFNLRHVSDTNSLMYDKYTKYGYLCIDHDSAIKVANLYNLNSNYINYCLNKY